MHRVLVSGLGLVVRCIRLILDVRRGGETGQRGKREGFPDV